MGKCITPKPHDRALHLPPRVLDEGHLSGIVLTGDLARAVIENQQFTIELLDHYATGTLG